jgi:hypothetical protein
LNVLWLQKISKAENNQLLEAKINLQMLQRQELKAKIIKAKDHLSRRRI